MTRKLKPFTIESFYGFLKEGIIMGAICTKCGQLSLPPKPMCPKCFSKDLKWGEIKKEGKLLTYSIIHVSPRRFQQLVPYVVGIVEFEDGGQLPGMIRNVDLANVKIGMALTLGVDNESIPEEWPQWPRYYFEPKMNSSNLDNL